MACTCTFIPSQWQMTSKIGIVEILLGNLHSRRSTVDLKENPSGELEENN